MFDAVARADKLACVLPDDDDVADADRDGARLATEEPLADMEGTDDSDTLVVSVAVTDKLARSDAVELGEGDPEAGAEAVGAALAVVPEAEVLGDNDGVDDVDDVARGVSDASDGVRRLLLDAEGHADGLPKALLLPLSVSDAVADTVVSSDAPEEGE